MAKIPVPRKQLEDHLARQVEYLENSIKLYDTGFAGEVQRMAVVVRVLVHDTPNSTSLLQQLGLKHATFYDTSYPYDPRNLPGHHSLAMVQMQSDPTGGSVQYQPALDIASQIAWEPFTKWWNEIVISDPQAPPQNRQMSRAKLVLTMANQDGGAHVDPEIDAFYADVQSANKFGWNLAGGPDAGKPLLGIESTSMRQVAHEMIITLRNIRDHPPGPPPPPPPPPVLTKRQQRRLRGRQGN